MYQTIDLNFPDATEGKLYIENGRWVIHVFPNLAETDLSRLDELRRNLSLFCERSGKYDDYVVHARDESEAKSNNR